MSPQGLTATELMDAPLNLVVTTVPNGVKNKQLMPFVGRRGIEKQNAGLGDIMGIEVFAHYVIKFIEKMVMIEGDGNIVLPAA